MAKNEWKKEKKLRRVGVRIHLIYISCFNLKNGSDRQKKKRENNSRTLFENFLNVPPYDCKIWLNPTLTNCQNHFNSDSSTDSLRSRHLFDNNFSKSVFLCVFSRDFIIIEERYPARDIWFSFFFLKILFIGMFFKG